MENNIEKFEIEGLKEVIAALKDLPDVLQNKLIKSFLQKTGRKFIVNELKTVLPYHQRSKQGIRVVQDKNDKNAIFAGPTTDIFWYRWADKGTVQRQTKKGYNRGTIIPKNQIRSVVDNQIQPIIKYANEEFGNEINKNLERRIKKINKVK